MHSIHETYTRTLYVIAPDLRSAVSNAFTVLADNESFLKGYCVFDDEGGAEQKLHNRHSRAFDVDRFGIYTITVTAEQTSEEETR
jgi:hypothetical protein